MDRFLFDVILPASEICNLEREQAKLLAIAKNGERAVVFGWRNTGKTSILKNIVVPAFIQQHKKGLILFVDFMGVSSMEAIQNRLRIAFENAVTKAQPGKTYLKSLASSFKSMRPTMSIDQLTGQLVFSFGFDTNSENSVDIAQLLREVGKYHKSNSAILIFDEFQDIAVVPEADALFRDALQNLPSDLPVIISGSKKHLLANLFAPAKAPLAGWGKDIQIPTILESAEYEAKFHQYVKKKFPIKNIKIDPKTTRFAIEQMQGIPEALNILCQHMLDALSQGTKVTQQEINKAIWETIDERAPRYNERMAKNSESENMVLTAIAKSHPVKSPKGKSFLRKLPNLSPSAIFGIIKRLENEAEIYHLPDGYVMADPLLGFYLRRFR